MSSTINNFYTEIGLNIREYRRQAGLTQADLAKRVGLSRPAISTIERGAQHLYLQQLSEIADALNVRPWQIWRCYSLRKDYRK